MHESSAPAMDFVEKNFRYTTMSFARLLDRAEAGLPVYLRALSADEPAGRPANLTEDFSELARDFRLPPELEHVDKTMHSLVLRVAGPVAMWLHYDVMANVLCQVRGRKRLVLFAPSAVAGLGFAAGASSSSVQAFTDDGEVSGAIAHLDPIVCDLEPGDVLFIPALWAHAARPTSGLSIAVNAFFRGLDDGYSAGRDVYGNRDVQAYENGRKDVQRLRRAFRDLPPDMSYFYLKRLAMELEESADAALGRG